MSISQHIPDAIKRASRSVGYALWLDHSDAYLGLPVVLEAALATGAGQPIAPLFSHLDAETKSKFKDWADND